MVVQGALCSRRLVFFVLEQKQPGGIKPAALEFQAAGLSAVLPPFSSPSSRENGTQQQEVLRNTKKNKIPSTKRERQQTTAARASKANGTAEAESFAGQASATATRCRTEPVTAAAAGGLLVVAMICCDVAVLSRSPTTNPSTTQQQQQQQQPDVAAMTGQRLLAVRSTCFTLLYICSACSASASVCSAPACVAHSKN